MSGSATLKTCPCLHKMINVSSFLIFPGKRPAREWLRVQRRQRWTISELAHQFSHRPQPCRWEYQEYFNSNVKISQQFLNHQDCIIRIQSFPSCPFTCPHGLPISQVMFVLFKGKIWLNGICFGWEFSFIFPFFRFAGIQICYLCVQQYFKVVSPAFKNTAANAFLLSANLNFEDSWPNSQLPPLLFVLRALWLRILISWFPDCFSSLDYNIRLQET